ncbi:S9 family peptidase [Streptomyces yaizuensis]|nr:prolyl oligopeptidase family serine peptidase [Streptomyces sp. YSPA8]
MNHDGTPVDPVRSDSSSSPFPSPSRGRAAEPSPASLRAPEFPGRFARTRRFSLGIPRQITVSPDGDRILFLRGTGGTDPVSRLWLYSGGRERMLADPVALAVAEDGTPDEERARRERAREASTGVVAYATDAAVRLAAFALGGRLWTVAPHGSAAPRPLATAGPVTDPRPSPDGRWIAYVTGGALHAVRADGSEDRVLAAPEGPDVVYGLAEYAAAESMGRTRGHWWSPASDALLVARVDTAPVGRRWVGDPADPDTPPRPVPYPAAGTANARVSLHLLRLDGERVAVRLPEHARAAVHPPGAWTDTAFEYVTDAGWDGHGPRAQVQTRDQRTAVLLAVDPADGTTTPVHTEHDPAWVELVPGVPGRTAAGTPVTAVVTDDGRRALRVGDAIAPPGQQLREVLAVDGERVWFTAQEDPTEVHVWCHSPEAGFVRVSEGPGVHHVWTGGGTTVLESWTESGHRFTVRREGAPESRIRVTAEEPAVVPRPQLLTLGARELRSHLYLPSWYEPGSGPLPVLLNPYAGPGMQLVVRARTWWGCVSQWFAEQGFAVLVTDGRGTPGRGPAWEKAVHGDRLAPALEDQIDALHAAAADHPFLDLGAVAIRGWSFGGYLAAGAVLHHPEVFHAAVAGGTPTDRRLYDTHWEERFLGHPEVFPEAYRRSSLLPYAGRLSRPLLLVHGLADDNVYVAHTLRLSSALLAAGRQHSVLPLAGAGHRVTRQEQVAGLLRYEVAFLKKSLNF